MNFINFRAALQENFKVITEGVSHLYEVELNKDEMWDLYLDSYPEGTNEIFRERREQDCSCCRQFVKNIGNIVVVKDGVVTTVWDFETNSEKYQPVLNALSIYVKSKIVTDVWVNKDKNVGTSRNFEKLDNGEILEWDHFHLELPNKFIDNSSKSEADVRGTLRDNRNVFKRSLDEITEDSLLTVLELISQNSLYKGEEWKAVLTEFYKHKAIYDKFNTEEEKGLYTWEQSVKIGGAMGRIKNHSIGTLLINIGEGIDLDLAVRKYEAIIAPENYKRPKAIFTKKMLADAQKTIQDLGYMDSLSRGYADLDDITVNNILFSNRDSAKRIAGMNVFDEMTMDIAVNPKQFAKVEEVSINDFIENILPSAQEIEVFLENKHASNMVSLIAPEIKDSKTMFKWDNNFSWAYSGNMTDSSMRDRVKSAGGNVEGVLRFSIQWNDDKYDGNDLDAHCLEPDGNQIYYGNKSSRRTGGQLDVDITNPRSGTPAVENITWASKSQMEIGKYTFVVNNYANRGGRDGFSAEIEYDGQIFTFDYPKELKNKEKVVVAEVMFDGTGFAIVEKLPSTTSTREIWSLKTNQFVPVSVIMNSPNYWNSQKGIGNKHFMFMLKGCTNPEMPNGYYNEFLGEELTKHRRVFEALGSKMAVKDTPDQLSGVGFSSTQRNDLLVKIKGNVERVVKVKI